MICSLTFDMIRHYGLFLKLLNECVPWCFLMSIMSGYLNMMNQFKWENTNTDYFEILCGTKQGGILSPYFFCLYIDELVSLEWKEGIGCHIISLFLACVLFADDFNISTDKKCELL